MLKCCKKSVSYIRPVIIWIYVFMAALCQKLNEYVLMCSIL